MKQPSKRFLWILLPTAALLSACSGTPFTDQDFIAKIFPNGYWDFLIQLIAFILLLIIVFFLGYKPVRNMLKKRQENIAKMIEDTESDQAIAHQAAMQSEETIAEGRAEAERILASAREQAEYEREQILHTAALEADAKRRKADEDIEAAKRASVEATRKEIVDVAILASETLLKREVGDADNKRLVADFVAELNDDTDGERNG